MSYYRLKVLMLNDKKRVNLLCEKMLNFANNNRKKQRGQELRTNPAFLRNNPRLFDDNLGLLLHPDCVGSLGLHETLPVDQFLELLHVMVSRVALDGLYEISELGLTNARNAYQMAHLIP